MATMTMTPQERRQKLADLKAQAARLSTEIERLRSQVLLPSFPQEGKGRGRFQSLTHQFNRLERLIAHVEAGGDPDDEV